VESLGLPYKFFGFDSAMSEVVNYALKVDQWMEKEGKKQLKEKMGI